MGPQRSLKELIGLHESLSMGRGPWIELYSPLPRESPFPVGLQISNLYSLLCIHREPTQTVSPFVSCFEFRGNVWGCRKVSYFRNRLPMNILI